MVFSEETLKELSLIGLDSIDLSDVDLNKDVNLSINAKFITISNVYAGLGLQTTVYLTREITHFNIKNKDNITVHTPTKHFEISTRGSAEKVALALLKVL